MISGLKTIVRQTYHYHQWNILIPAVNTCWRKEQQEVIASAQGVPLVVGGDGRADSPDHCAKYGSYTIHDLKQNKVLDLQLVQVSFILYMY